MNKLLLIGRATKKPDLQISKNGMSYAILSIAVNEKQKDENGNNKVNYIDIKAFDKVANLLNKYVEKGQLLSIDAKVVNNNYEKEGKTIYTYDFILNEFEFLGSGKKEEEKTDATEAVNKAIDGDKSDLPF